MGPVNWLAVMVAAVLAGGLAALWHGPLFRTRRQFLRRVPHPKGMLWPFAVALPVGALMLGHAFARIGPETLAAKPWLYFMQSGGIAVAFVIPAVWLTLAREGLDRQRQLIACGYWLAAYLLMGAVFWVLQ
ncbi:MAG TPA: DUF1761 domain-containing protein [Novosphingobium sp.]|nr:DUF1761 domain-containing protein [Novosphingobium sp.]